MSTLVDEKVGVVEAMTKEFGAIPELRYILMDKGGLVLLALDSHDEFLRSRIFELQGQFITRFPDADFDFNIVTTRGRTPHEIATGAMVAYSRA